MLTVDRKSSALPSQPLQGDSDMNQKLRLRICVAVALGARSRAARWPSTDRRRAGRTRAAARPDWTFTGNVGLFSQYVFRGISQTNEKPALQGGFDLGHKSGFYVGTWASNISWLSTALRTSRPLEPRVGLLRRLQVAASPAGLRSRPRRPLLLVPGHLPAGYVKPTPPSCTRALAWKWVSRASTATASTTTLRLPRRRRPTAPTTASCNATYDDRREGHRR